MSKRLAVIDLGTNTFHLLIVEVTKKGKFKEIFRKRVFVKLASDGIASIGNAPFGRGLRAMEEFEEVLSQYNVMYLKAIGTAALRVADNSHEFIKQVLDVTGIQVELIDGDMEASYIYLGVRQIALMKEQAHLIMDIGGGSVEFIIANDKEIFWKQSFPIGMSILKNAFHIHDHPILATEIQAINDFLEKELSPFFSQYNKFTDLHFVGVSGIFELIQNLISPKLTDDLIASVTIAEFNQLYDRAICLNNKELSELENMPMTRVEMIAVSFVLIRFIVSKLKLEAILISKYTMKEGILWRMLKDI